MHSPIPPYPPPFDQTEVPRTPSETEAAIVSQPGMVRRDALRPGDLLVVLTNNSIYRIRVLNRTDVLVSGGWFDRAGCAPLRTTLTGCTGDAGLDSHLAAARGLCIAFGNDVVTSRVTDVYYYPNTEVEYPVA